MSFFKVDLSKVETSNNIPAGDYHMRCVEVKLEDKPDNKQFIVAQFQVIGGDHDGRKVYERFTTIHPNPKATQVGLGKLKRFLTAAGYKNPNELELMEMTGLECLCVIKIEEQEGYDARNVISNFKKLTNTAPTSSSPFGV